METMTTKVYSIFIFSFKKLKIKRKRKHINILKILKYKVALMSQFKIITHKPFPISKDQTKLMPIKCSLAPK